jgi:hypothetical protein
VFLRVGWIVTWLFAPLAGLTAVGLAIFMTLTGYDELVLPAAMGASALVLWLVLCWGVARLLAGRRRLMYVAGCAVIAVGVAGASVGKPFLAAATGHPTTVVTEIEKP